MSNSRFAATLQNLLLFVVSSLITLVALEAAFRLYSKATEAERLEALARKIERPAAGQTVPLGRMVQLSTNPGIIYELIPDIEVNFVGAAVVINAAGFRGPLVTPEKTPGQRRIVGIGDSVMFGWGVEENEAYLSVLERKLNRDGSQKRWDIVNTAVPGYNTAMEVEVLKEKGLQYSPDIVIVGFVANDFGLPRFIRQPTNYLALDRSFILDRLTRWRNLSNSLSKAPKKFTGAKKEGLDIDTVPPAYRGMVGLAGVLNSFDTLKALSDEHQFEVILLVHTRQPKELRSSAKAHGFHIINSRHLWFAHARTRHYDDPKAASKLSKTDPHPSVAAHRVIGEGLYELIQRIDE